VEISISDGLFFDNDERDIVYALYRNECVGQANVTVNTAGNTADVYLTVLGQDEMNRKQIQFQLWQASTGKVYDLTASQNVLFSHGFVYGCDGEPLVLTTSGSERRQIQLYAGWNWSSVNLDLHATGGRLETCMSAAQPWTEGDLIKNPATRQFSTYNEANNAFAGTLLSLHHKQIYMIYTANGNTMRISGELLPSDSMIVSVRGDGQWSPMPCLLDQRTSVTEALADYYQKAGTGDMIKAHNRFATFSADKRFWLSSFGHIDAKVVSGVIWNRAPYTRLYIPSGNANLFLATNAFNTMRPMEFIMDQYVAVFATYHLKGWILNRIPLINRLRLREVVGFNFLYGGLSNKNDFYSDPTGLYKMPEGTQAFGTTPYMEYSIGVENILKFLRIDFVRRLSYLDGLEGWDRWFVRIDLKFQL
jgi:hypothetical protein